MKHSKFVLLAIVFAATVTLSQSCTKHNAENGSTTVTPITQDMGKEAKEWYQCPMHPHVHSDQPGACPICHMTLEKVKKPVKADAVSETKIEKKIKFYRNPMDPSVHSDKPAKDSMGMDYIPVYDEEKSGDSNRGEVNFTSDQLKLSGTSKAAVEKKNLMAMIRVPGRVLGGERVSFQAFEQDLSWIKTGMKFTAETSALPGEKLTGRITSVESILDPMTRTVRVDGTITSKNAKLSSEASLVGKLEFEANDVLSIPESSVLHTGDHDLVYVSNDKGGFLPRQVVIGMKAQGFYEVKSGLTEGDQVSSGPNFLLDSESQIQAQ